MEKRVKYLVVDSGPLIKASPVHEYAENIYTVSGVIKEIKDKATLQRLQFLPYTLNIKEPTADSCKRVMEFSKKTGDYINLSAVDQQILALTYQLEKENVGIEHLSKEPTLKVTNKPELCSTQIHGFYIPKKKSEAKSDSMEFKDLEKGHINKEDIDEKSNLSDDLNMDNFTYDTNEEKVKNKIDEENRNYTDSQEAIDFVDGTEEESEDNEEAGWITPQNISEIEEKMEVLKLDSSVVVACITTDYCMQNVLIQMGLNVISVDGMLIKQTRIFILRCYSCYKTTNDTTKVFCSNCGNKTLKRVSVTVSEDGTKNIHINFKRPLPIRGTRYSLPFPRGGKHSMNPIVCEDQPIPQNRPTKKALEKLNILDADYVAHKSPFLYNDVISRAAQLGIHSNKTHKTKKNPNASTKRTGNKKKRN